MLRIPGQYAICESCGLRILSEGEIGRRLRSNQLPLSDRIGVSFFGGFCICPCPDPNPPVTSFPVTVSCCNNTVNSSLLATLEGIDPFCGTCANGLNTNIIFDTGMSKWLGSIFIPACPGGLIPAATSLDISFACEPAPPIGFQWRLITSVCKAMNLATPANPATCPPLNLLFDLLSCPVCCQGPAPGPLKLRITG